jgi:hypothetical protein
MVTEIQEGFAVFSFRVQVLWTAGMCDHENDYIFLSSQKEDKMSGRIFTCDDMQWFVTPHNFIIACALLATPISNTFLIPGL